MDVMAPCVRTAPYSWKAFLEKVPRLVLLPGVLELEWPLAMAEPVRPIGLVVPTLVLMLAVEPLLTA